MNPPRPIPIASSQRAGTGSLPKRPFPKNARPTSLENPIDLTCDVIEILDDDDETAKPNNPIPEKKLPEACHSAGNTQNTSLTIDSANPLTRLPQDPTITSPRHHGVKRIASKTAAKTTPFVRLGSSLSSLSSETPTPSLDHDDVAGPPPPPAFQPPPPPSDVYPAQFSENNSNIGAVTLQSDKTTKESELSEETVAPQQSSTLEQSKSNSLKPSAKKRQRFRCNQCQNCMKPDCGECPKCLVKANGKRSIGACERKPCLNLLDKPSKASGHAAAAAKKPEKTPVQNGFTCYPRELDENEAVYAVAANGVSFLQNSSFYAEEGAHDVVHLSFQEWYWGRVTKKYTVHPNTYTKLYNILFYDDDIRNRVPRRVSACQRLMIPSSLVRRFFTQRFVPSLGHTLGRRMPR